jgi:3-dehydroquinate synthase
MRDKKNDGGALTLILSRGIGRAFIERGVDPARLTAFLA